MLYAEHRSRLEGDFSAITPAQNDISHLKSVPAPKMQCITSFSRFSRSQGIIFSLRSIQRSIRNSLRRIFPPALSSPLWVSSSLLRHRTVPILFVPPANVLSFHFRSAQLPGPRLPPAPHLKQQIRGGSLGRPRNRVYQNPTQTRFFRPARRSRATGNPVRARRDGYGNRERAAVPDVLATAVADHYRVLRAAVEAQKRRQLLGRDVCGELFTDFCHVWSSSILLSLANPGIPLRPHFHEQISKEPRRSSIPVGSACT